jgi:hypothetical protein
MRSSIIPFLKLSASFEVNIHELMVHCFASVIDEICNRNEASLIEIIPKASSHHCPIAIMKSVAQFLFALPRKLLSLGEVSNHVRLQFQALETDVDNLFDY